MLFAGEALNGRSGHAAGRQLLERLYRQAAGEPMPPIGESSGGKPRFTSGDYHFSITHTPRHVFCVLARENVGLDAEELERRIPPKLAERVLSPREQERCQAAEDRNLALLTFWVLKEAEAKLTGRGLGSWIRQTDFSYPHPAVWTQDGCVLALLTGEDVYAL